MCLIQKLSATQSCTPKALYMGRRVTILLCTTSFFLINAVMGRAESPITLEFRVCALCVCVLYSLSRKCNVCVYFSFHLPCAVASLCPQCTRLRHRAISESASKGFSLPLIPNFYFRCHNFWRENILHFCSLWTFCLFLALVGLFYKFLL